MWYIYYLIFNHPYIGGDVMAIEKMSEILYP